ncbi:uncharacterized protein LOC116337468 [Contarinia nasturtii]|uniref:uncharacterized protein LOC116337468 n=1 Tax=Contarinia nasturtii TaxID=265458 RepID=UPI0012D40FC0|nr:uncharacterized protein LOC116337468 [Contarinia nasturtii]
MDILKANYMEKYEKLRSTIKTTKFNLGRLEHLSDSIKPMQFNDSDSTKFEVVLSSLCTKFMQLNADLKKIERINTTPIGKNDAQNTENLLILYSMLDEFNLNESEKPPQTSNGHVVYTSNYTGLGYISHIVNESAGIVYILDENSMPDQLILYGATPKPLTHTPEPGQMFAYFYQEKYMVRAVRLEYECREKNSSKQQYGALLIDIGCVIQIASQQCGIYEVTDAAKLIPPYAKMSRLVHVPDNHSICDLLHTLVKYKIICNDKNLMLVNIISAGVNPFAIEQQNKWNFYKYFFGNSMLKPQKYDEYCHDKIEKKPSQSLTTPQPPPTPPPRTMPPSTRVSAKQHDFNPFADPSQYLIKNVPEIPLKKSSNPFARIQLTKIVNQLSDEYIEKYVTHVSTNPKSFEMDISLVENGISFEAPQTSPTKYTTPKKIVKAPERVTTSMEVNKPTMPTYNIDTLITPRRKLTNLLNRLSDDYQNDETYDLTSPKKVVKELFDEKDRSETVPHTSINGEFEAPRILSTNHKENPTPKKIQPAPVQVNKLLNVTKETMPIDIDRDILRRDLQNISGNSGANEPVHHSKPTANASIVLEPKSTSLKSMHTDIDLEILQRCDNGLQNMIVLNGVKEPMHRSELTTNQNMGWAPKATPMKSAESEKIALKTTAPTMADFPKPSTLSIGSTILVEKQHIVSVEEFYGTMINDPNRVMDVDEFTKILNDDANPQRFVKYTANCLPKLNDKIFALFNDWYYRAKVISVIDKYVFSVYYVDYGNIGKVRVSQTFKYEEAWDQYAEYAMHFRLNRIKQINRCCHFDPDAKNGLEQIMGNQCTAKIVAVEYSLQLNRTTYIVDLCDENGLDVAKTLINKNLAYLNETGNLANHPNAHAIGK